MELKKYVLLSDDTIVDVSKENYYLTQTGLIRYRENAVMQKTLMGTVKSTSDNILDLVDPCSLWDLAGDLYEYNIGGYVMIDKVFEDTDFSKREVTAIYKRQTNGDYKRYEVV